MDSTFPSSIRKELFNMDNDLDPSNLQDQWQRKIESGLGSVRGNTKGFGTSAVQTEEYKMMQDTPSLLALILRDQYQQRKQMPLQQQQQLHAQKQRETLQLNSVPKTIETQASDNVTREKRKEQDELNNRRRCSSSKYCAEEDLSPQKDICFGRGQRVQRREANVAFRKIITDYQEMYEQAKSRDGKKEVIKLVSEVFAKRGYRFFKENLDRIPVAWVAVPNSQVEYKIGHSFRSNRKILKRKQCHEQNPETVGAQELGCVDNSAHCCDDLATEKNVRKIILRINNHAGCDIGVGDKRENCVKIKTCYNDLSRESIRRFKSFYEIPKSPSEKESIFSRMVQKKKTQDRNHFFSMKPPPHQFDCFNHVDSRFNDGTHYAKTGEMESLSGCPMKEIVGDVFSIVKRETSRIKESFTQKRSKRSHDLNDFLFKGFENKPKKQRFLPPDENTSHPATNVPPNGIQRVISSRSSSVSLETGELEMLNKWKQSVASNSRQGSDATITQKVRALQTNFLVSPIRYCLASHPSIVSSNWELKGTVDSNYLKEKCRVTLAPSSYSAVMHSSRDLSINGKLLELIEMITARRKELAALKRPINSRFDVDNVYLHGLSLKIKNGLRLTDFEVDWLERMKKN